MCHFRWRSLPLFSFVCVLTFQPFSASGQMVTTGFPLVGVRDGFSEGIRSNWSLTGPGIYNWFNNNSGSGIPQFGGFQPGAGLSGGFAFNRGAYGANFGFNFSQGYSRSMTSTTPVVNGFGGSPLIFQNSLQRPFVTSLIPNVGNGAAFRNLGAANTIRGRLLRGEFSMRDGKVVPTGGAKRAETPAKPKRVPNRRPLVDAAPPTRAERQAQAEAQETEQLLAIRKYLQKGKDAEAKGKPNVAKLYYKMAARRADGDLKRQALASIERVSN